MKAHTNFVAHLSWVYPAIVQSAEITQNNLNAYVKKREEIATPPAGVNGVWVVNQQKTAAEIFTKITEEISRIHSAMSVVGSAGGVALTSEMHVVCNGIEEGRITLEAEQKALLSVMTGLIMLPSFIRMVIDGAPDSASILSKPINEIRAVRGVPLLVEENILPSTMAFVFTPPPRCVETTLEQRDASYKEARGRFFPAFSEFLESQSKAPLETMRAVFTSLHRDSHLPEVGCFWWIGEALVEALMSAGIRQRGKSIPFLTSLSVAIQKASVGGERAAIDALGAARFKEALYLLSMSTTLSDDAKSILDKFKVPAAIDNDALKQLQQKLDGAKTVAMTEVVGQVSPLLDTAMVALGRAVNSKSDAGFQPQLALFNESIRSIANVMFIINEEPLASVARLAASRVEGIADRSALDDATIEGLKTDLLYLDTAIHKLDENEATAALGVIGIDPGLMATVTCEALADLISTRRSIALHVESGEAKDELRTGLEKLISVGGSLKFVGACRVSNLLEGVATAMLGMLEKGKIEPSVEFSQAASAMVAVEMFLESIKDRLIPSATLLDSAEASLKVLGITVAATTDTSPKGLLIERFEAIVEQQDDDPFLSEMIEARPLIERCIQHFDYSTPKAPMDLYEATAKLAVSAKIQKVEAVFKLCNAISNYARGLYTLSGHDDFVGSESKALVKEALELCVRTMDEYSAKGVVSIFVHDVVKQLETMTALVDAAAKVELEEAAAGEEPAVADDQVHDAKEPESTPAVEVQSPAVGDDVDSAERPYPEGVDPFLISLFRQEYAEHNAILVDALESGVEAITQDFTRSVHTLRGICATADYPSLNKVFASLEDRLCLLMADGYLLTLDDCAHLLKLLEDCNDAQAIFPWEVVAPLSDAWQERAIAFGCLAPAAEVEPAKSSTPEPEQPVITPDEAPAPEHSTEVPAGIEVALVTQAVLVDVQPHQEMVVQSLPAAPAESSAIGAASDEDAAPSIEYNLEMAEFYLEEVEDVLPELQANLSSWLGNMSDQGLITTIKRQMHTLKGAAAMAECTAIRDITHHMESLFESLSLNMIPADSDCGDLVSIVLDVIESLTSAVRASLPYSRPVKLIYCLEMAVERNRVDLCLLEGDVPDSLGDQSQVAPTIDPIAPEPDPAQDALHSGAGEDIDGVTDEAGLVAAQPQKRKKKARRSGRGQGINTQGAIQAQGSGGQAQAEGITSQPPVESTPLATSPVAPVVFVAETAQPEVVVDVPVTLAAVAPVLVQPSKPVVQAQPQAKIPQPAAPVQPDLPASAKPPARVLTPEQAARRASTEPLRQAKLLALFQADKDKQSMPVSSDAVRDLLGSSLARVATQRGNKKSGTSEKIKVDQQLLETAVVQSGELTSTRHHQLALHTNLMLSITSLREKLESQGLHHNQFINALRAHINQPTIRLGKATAAEQTLQLERFDDVSAMAVQAGARLEQMLDDIEEVFETGRHIYDSFKQQGRLISSLQRDLIDSRLVPFRNINPSLNQVVTSTAAMLKKPVQYKSFGGDVILDKKILDALKDPLMHILRNAIDHGIESPDDRAKTGKPAEGTISIGVLRKAKNMVVTVTDDGRGIDHRVIRQKAIEKGIIRDTDELTERETIRLITHSGFSTAQQTTHISGRGVGLDIVASAVESMGGVLLIDSEAGQGTVFTLELPFSIGSNLAMVCQAGGQWFAIPTFTMDQVVMCSREALENQIQEFGHAVYEYEGQDFNVVHLADLIAMPEMRTKTGKPIATLLLCSHGANRIAIEVDQADSMPEIHVRELEGVLSTIRGLIGETEMQDGSSAFVLDVMELVRINLKKTETGYTVRQNRVRTVRREEKPLAFVVDDAISYRKILTKHFESRGFTVISARDGQDALDMLPLEKAPDIVTVDVEMPRVDGFDLTARLRAMADFDDIPIIMLTTRTGLEERGRAAGVNVFLNKPYDPIALDKAVKEVRPDLMREEAKA